MLTAPTGNKRPETSSSGAQGGANMGAIGPQQVVARTQARIKSVSLETPTSIASLNQSTQEAQKGAVAVVASNQQPVVPPIKIQSLPQVLRSNDANKQQQRPLNRQKSAQTQEGSVNGKQLAGLTASNIQTPAQRSGSGGGGGGSNLLTVVQGSPLKSSASTSCLFTASDDSTGENNSATSSTTSSSSLAALCEPTRASLTHEWKKLKTPNKCRECSLLVYFNGRECSFCGFVAHKKCVVTLVIKCAGQLIAQSAATSGGNYKGNNVINKSTGKTNKPPVVQPIFGQPLVSSSSTSGNGGDVITGAAGVSEQVDLNGHQVIDFIRRFVYEIDTRGLTSRGIYRVSSIKSKVDRLCSYYDQNLSSLVDLSSFHPNIIANALKMFLRQLPEPLLTDKLYTKFIDLGRVYSVSNESKTAAAAASKLANTGGAITTSPSPLNYQQHHHRLSTTTAQLLLQHHHQHHLQSEDYQAYNPAMIAEFREIIDELPAINRHLLAIIMRHLRRVADKSHENQMSAKNLAIIFGPTLLSADNESLAIVDNVHQARVVELMITWANQIFPQYANYESTAVIDLDRSRAVISSNQRGH